MGNAVSVLDCWNFRVKILNCIIFFPAKILSRRSRLSRWSRAPSRLSRPRPIDCDRGIQLVQYSRQYTATHILFPRSFYIYICTSVENRTYKTRHYPPSDASPQRVRVTALAVALHDAPAGIAHFSSLSCPERNEACCGVPAGPAWRQCLAVWVGEISQSIWPSYDVVMSADKCNSLVRSASNVMYRAWQLDQLWLVGGQLGEH